LKSPESMTKAPSLECWIGSVEVAYVNDEGNFSRLSEMVSLMLMLVMFSFILTGHTRESHKYCEVDKISRETFDLLYKSYVQARCPAKQCYLQISILLRNLKME
jgi:hypothetical protein